PVLDAPLFHHGQFQGANPHWLGQEFERRGRSYQIIQGYFPDSILNVSLPPISFVHLDVDVYEATRSCLTHLFTSGMLLPHSLILLDDVNRSAAGVNRALAEVLSAHPNYTLLPLFPSQGLIIGKSMFDAAIQ